MTRLDITSLRVAACGRWPDILNAIGVPPEYLTRPNQPCPGCGGTDRFSFTDHHGSGSFVCRALARQGGDGFELVRHVLDCDLRQALASVAETLAIESPRAPAWTAPPVTAATPDEGERTHRRAQNDANLRRLWEAGRAIAVGDAVARYLTRRGIHDPACPTVSPALRHHPALAYWQTGGAHPVRLGVFPAMLAAVHDADGTMVAIHRTYLDSDGHKATIRAADGALLPVRKLQTRGAGVMPGAAIRLVAPRDDRLALAEGIETALAVHQITGVPVWAAVSANGLATVHVPPAVRQVVIAADHDPNGAGQTAAHTLADRLRGEGRQVEVVLPTETGYDWLDVLNAERERA